MKVIKRELLVKWFSFLCWLMATVDDLSSEMDRTEDFISACF